MNLASFCLIFGTAIISATNPSSISIFTMLVATILGGRKSSKQLFINALFFLFGLFFLYLILGLGVVYALEAVPDSTYKIILLSLSIIIAVAGLIEIKDYFKYGQGPSIRVPRKFADTIHRYVTRSSGLTSALVLGSFAGLSMLPAVGAPYLAILVIIRGSVSPLFSTSLYNLVFVMPMMLILLLVLNGAKISSVIKWKEETKGTMRLFLGLLLILLAVIMGLIIQGKVSFAK